MLRRVHLIPKRVLSITPENFETPMGELEQVKAMNYMKHNAIKPLGHPNEIASLYAVCAYERMGYLTGVDIICDGGYIAGDAGFLRR